jgi:DNA-binding CsgD family transcriptional regulator
MCSPASDPPQSASAFQYAVTLGSILDDLGTGLAIYERGREREVGRNGRLDQLVRDEPDHHRLAEAISRLGSTSGPFSDSLAMLRSGMELELSGGSYRLVRSRAPAGALLVGEAVLVLVDRLRRRLPSTRELRNTFGLRGREAQVALLAAEGLSNPAIAMRLGLSAHTVRHYVERVFDRLGLHSRKTLALHLIMTGREPGVARMA